MFFVGFLLFRRRDEKEVGKPTPGRAALIPDTDYCNSMVVFFDLIFLKYREINLFLSLSTIQLGHKVARDLIICMQTWVTSCPNFHHENHVFHFILTSPRVFMTFKCQIIEHKIVSDVW